MRSGDWPQHESTAHLAWHSLSVKEGSLSLLGLPPWLCRAGGQDEPWNSEAARLPGSAIATSGIWSIWGQGQGQGWGWVGSQLGWFYHPPHYSCGLVASPPPPIPLLSLHLVSLSCSQSLPSNCNGERLTSKVANTDICDLDMLVTEYIRNSISYVCKAGTLPA